jgi:alkanesulfonate monooxygenase SsuD/methylene tetrahydromethanopterin reductase-like flavin-dependent oxidoreductase (luciferase family)
MVTRTADDGMWPVHPWVASGQGTVRFGIMVHATSDWKSLRELVRLVEDLGYDVIWAYDHPVTIGAADCWTTLAQVATATTAIRLGSAVACAGYRHPALLARLAADVDQLSDGRLVFGIGAGDDDREFSQLALPFPRLRERQAALEEALEIVRGLWTGEATSLDGRHHSVREARLQSVPVQRPRVPILIGGGGERVTLRQVARYADMCNFGPNDWTGGARQIGDVLRKYGVLRDHCEAAGRDYDSIARSYFEGIVLGDTTGEAEVKRERTGFTDESLRAFGPEDAIRHYQELVDAGVQQFMLWMPPGEEETLRRLAGEVRPAIRPPVAQERATRADQTASAVPTGTASQPSSGSTSASASGSSSGSATPSSSSQRPA